MLSMCTHDVIDVSIQCYKHMHIITTVKVHEDSNKRLTPSQFICGVQSNSSQNDLRMKMLECSCTLALYMDGT